jgi:hypothetical protein
VLASCSQITTSSSFLDLEARLSRVAVFVVFSAWDSLALSASESLRACLALVKVLIAIDHSFFSSDSACCVVSSCAAQQESMKGIKGTEVGKEK